MTDTDWMEWAENRFLPLLAACVGIAALLRIIGLNWDQGLMLHPDEGNLVRAAADLTVETGFSTSFYAYNTLALVLPRLLAEIVSTEPATHAQIALASRGISAFFSTTTVLLAGLLAARIDRPFTGLVAAAMIATSGALIQWAHFGTTESALALGVIALWLVAVRYLERTDRLRTFALLSGTIIGVSLGMKSTGALFAAIPITAILLGGGDRPRDKSLATVFAALVASALFLLTTPGVLFDTGTYWDVMRFEGGVLSGRNDVFWTWQFNGTTDVLFEMRQLLHLLPGGVWLLALSGLGVAVLRRGRKAWVILLFLAVYMMLIFQLHAKFIRYAAPYIPVLLIFASIAVSAIAHQRSATLKSLAVVALTIFALSGISKGLSYLAVDPRIAVAAEVARLARPEDQVLIEPRDVADTRFGLASSVVLPLLDNPSEGAPEALGDALSSADWLVLTSRRHWGVLPRLQDRFPHHCGYYSALMAGDTGFHEVDRFRRGHLLGGFFDPGLDIEETAAAFDSPKTILFRRMRPVSADQIALAIRSHAAGCDGQAVIADVAGGG